MMDYIYLPEAVTMNGGRCICIGRGGSANAYTFTGTLISNAYGDGWVNESLRPHFSEEEWEALVSHARRLERESWERDRPAWMAA